MNLNESEAFNAFLDKLKNQNNIASTFENCFKNSFKKIINQLEKNLLHAKEMKTQKIENDECHKKITQLEKNVYDSKISQNYLQAQINSQTSELRFRRNFPRIFNLDYGDKVKKYGDDLQKWPYSAFGINI